MLINLAPAWTIRDATPADHTALQAMSDAIQQAEIDLVGYPLLSVAEISAPYFAELLARVETDNGVLLVCESGGRLIGFAAGHRETDDDGLVDAAFNQHALLSDLYVDPAFRSFGVGQALMAAFAERMRASGCAWLRIWAKARNQRAIAAYLRFGFEPYETVFAKRL